MKSTSTMEMRRLIIAAGGALAVGAAAAGGIQAWRLVQPAWDRWYYPPAPAPAPSGMEILKEHEGEVYRSFLREHVRVKARIDEARARGEKVDFLDAKMDRAMKLARDGYYLEAERLLNIVDMQVPRKPEKLEPVGPAQPPQETRIPAAPVRRSASSTGIKKSRKAKKKTNQ